MSASTMSARQFKGLLTRITNKGRELDALISQGIAYCVDQHVNHGQKTPWQALLDACPVYARKVVRDAQSACNNADKGDEAAIAEVSQSATDALEERRMKTSAQRKQARGDSTSGSDRQESPQPGKVPPQEAYRLSHTNKAEGGKDDITHLTAEEYEVALKAVEAHRKAQQAPKATSKKAA